MFHSHHFIKPTIAKARRNPRSVWRNAGRVVVCISVLSQAGTASAQVSYNIMSNVSYAAEGNPAQVMDIYLPNTAGSRPVVYLLHGNCWTGGDKSGTADTAQMLAGQGFVVVNMNYTLVKSGDAKTLYPKAWMDAMKAVRHIRMNAASYGVDTTKQAVWGESAGGTLAWLLTARPIFTPSWTTDVYSYSMNASVVAHARWDFTHRDPALAPETLDCAEKWMGVRRTENPTKFANSNPINYIGKYTPFTIVQCNFDDTIVLPTPHCEAARTRFHSFKRPHYMVNGSGGHYIAASVQKESMHVLMARFALVPR